jgi:hypothetical protein
MTTTNLMTTDLTIPNILPTNINDRLAKLRQQAAQTGEVGRPAPGDCLAGILIGWTKAVGTYGEGYQILVQDEGGYVLGLPTAQVRITGEYLRTY